MTHDEDIEHGTFEGYLECRRQVRGACVDCIAAWKSHVIQDAAA